MMAACTQTWMGAKLRPKLCMASPAPSARTARSVARGALRGSSLLRPLRTPSKHPITRPNRSTTARPHAAASSDGGSRGSSTEEPIGKRLYRSASGVFESAKKAAEDLDREHEITRKASDFGSTATKKAKETYAQVEDDLKRTVREVDRKYDVRGKTSQTFKSIREQAQSVDQQYGIRRKLQNLLEDARRAWPDIKRRTQQFINSPLGQGLMFAAVLYGLVSGILFKLLAYAFLIFWGLAILGIPQRIAQQRMAQQQEQQAQAGPGGPRRAASGGYYGAGGPYGAYYQQQPGGPGGAGPRQQQSTSGSNGGDVIDVEWDSVEDKRK